MEIDIDCRYKQINGFKDYFITEHGDVYSKRLRGNEKEPHIHKMKPKNPGDGSKYLNIILCRDDGQFTKSIHRLVAEHFVDGYFEGAEVHHIDGNNRNNNYNNLQWVTTKYNINQSYISSGKDARRNFKVTDLYDPHGVFLGSFQCFREVEEFINDNNINVSTSSLRKYCTSNGYTIEKHA